MQMLGSRETGVSLLLVVFYHILMYNKGRKRGNKSVQAEKPNG